MKYRWSIATPQPEVAAELARQTGLPPVLVQCLLNRGLATADHFHDFLAPRLKRLGDPLALPNMAAAVARLMRARAAGERLVIFGDYDVDGVTATALLHGFLGHFGWRCDWYLPHRMEEGYGLSRDGAENCLRQFDPPGAAAGPAGRPSLILAVDCGSTSSATIAWLKTVGVEVIVLDHHQVADPPPPAVAVVNPQLAEAAAGGPAAGTPFCSAGLAFKLAHALLKQGREQGLPGARDYDLRPWLDLVALGTIADLVPLTGENRILAAAGLKVMNTSQRPGVLALKQVAKSPAELDTHDVAFQLAPRLNAAGRLESAGESLRLLLAGDAATARPLAEILEARNQERQRIEKGIVAEALAEVRAGFNAERDLVIVAGRATWHIGVVGIVASRVLQEFYRPVIILGGDQAGLRGSGRSIAGFDLALALRECDSLLTRHGGHAMAAGLSLAPGNLEALRARLNDLAARCLRPGDLLPVLRLDAAVGLGDLTLELLGELDGLKPTGQGNAAVQLCARGVASARGLLRMGKEQQHMKFWVTDGVTTHEAVWWNAGGKSLPPGRFDLAFAPSVNEFKGRRTLQLKVLDIVAAAAG